MIKSLTEQGNGWLLVIPKTMIKLLGLSLEKSKVQFKIKDKTLYIQEIFPDNPDYDKYLIRKLSKKNSSCGFYMPDSILKLIEVKPETDKVDLEINDNVLIVRKAE